MAFDPKKHHRRSIRMPEYDYSEPGAYFVTICTRRWRCLFGEISDGGMVLNDAGLMVERWWHELTRKFPAVGLDDHVVMPNHTHGIVLIGMERDERGELRPLPDVSMEANATLFSIVQWFKTMTTNYYIRGVRQHAWPPFPGKLWHRNYYEHVIRDDDSLNRIREYIRTNPERWELDRENPHRKGLDRFDLWLDSFKKPEKEQDGSGDDA